MDFSRARGPSDWWKPYGQLSQPGDGGELDCQSRRQMLSWVSSRLTILMLHRDHGVALRRKAVQCCGDVVISIRDARRHNYIELVLTR